PVGRHGPGRLERRSCLPVLPQARRDGGPARWEPLRWGAADAHRGAHTDGQSAYSPARRAVGGAGAGDRAGPRPANRRAETGGLDHSALGAESQVRSAAGRSRLHHREGRDSLGGAHGPPPRGRRRPPRLPGAPPAPRADPLISLSPPPRGGGAGGGGGNDARRKREKMKTLIKNIGAIVSGDIARPLLDADSVVVADGTIAAVGRALDV